MPINPYDPPSPMDEPINPYQAPRAPIIESPGVRGPELEKLSGGQKLVIYSILVYFACLVLYGLGTFAVEASMSKEEPNPSLGAASIIICAGLAMLTSIVMGIVGIFRMGSGLGIHFVFRIFMIPLMMIPLLGFAILVFMNSRATKRLRAAGYHVGFLGASKGP